MANKIYTDKYLSSNFETGSRATISASLCEKIISILSDAKTHLSNGDKVAWLQNLAKVPNEIGALMSIISIPELEEWGIEMQKYYLHISYIISQIMSESLPSSSVDNIIQKLFETRDLWKSIEINYLEKSRDKAVFSGNEGLI